MNYTTITIIYLIYRFSTLRENPNTTRVIYLLAILKKHLFYYKAELYELCRTMTSAVICLKGKIRADDT